MQIEPPVFHTKKEGVYRALRDAIIRCQLAPQTRLVAEEVARQMGVSTIPVREALQQLQAEGLVRIVPHVGAMVAPVPVQAVDEVLTLLERIESALAPRACANRSPEDLQALSALLEDMEAAERAGDGEGWAWANSAFHRRLAAAARMPLGEELANRLYDAWDRLRCYILGRRDLAERMQLALVEHQAILDSLGAGDSRRLQRLLRVHRRSALRAFHRASRTAR